MKLESGETTRSESLNDKGDGIGQQLEEDIHWVKSIHLGWGRLKHVSGLRCRRCHKERWGSGGWLTGEREGRGVRVRHRNETERPPHPCGREGVQSVLGVRRWGTVMRKLRKLTSNGFTCVCSKLGYQVGYTWQVWCCGKRVGLREGAYPGQIKVCSIGYSPIPSVYIMAPWFQAWLGAPVIWLILPALSLLEHFSCLIIVFIKFICLGFYTLKAAGICFSQHCVPSA